MAMPPAAAIPKRPRPRKRTVAAAVAVIVVLAALGAYLVLRPATIREVLTRDRWSPGTVNLAGAITQVQALNTTYGTVVLLGLEGDPVCPRDGMSVFGNPEVTYRPGEWFRTTLHFTDYRFNGAAAIAAPELACPFPAASKYMGLVADSISLVAGILLMNQGTDAQGWTAYELVMPNGDVYPTNVGPLTVLRSPAVPPAPLNGPGQWLSAYASEYTALSGGYPGGPVIDRMETFANGTSPGGRLRFLDSDGDGSVGDGDSILVRLDSEGERTYQTHLLDIGGLFSGGEQMVRAVKLILNGPAGPYEFLSEPDSWVQLVHDSETPGATANSSIRVGRTLGSALPWSAFAYLFYKPDGTFYEGPLNTGTTPFGPGYVIDGTDGNGNGLLDTGDRLLFSGLPNATRASFQLREGGLGGRPAGDITWYPGYGHVTGALPDVTLVASGSNPYRFDVNVSYAHPELAIGKTLTVSLKEDDLTVVDRAPLVAGLVATWPGGNLTFDDRDANGALSTGDAFLLQAADPHRYHLDLTVLFVERLGAADTSP